MADTGRPETTEEQKQEMLQKLEPYLKSGLSVRKSLKEAQIPSSTFYDILSRDTKFSEQIDRFQQFIPVLLNSSIVRQLQSIIQKQNIGSSTPLTKEDIDFLKWFATNSNLTKEEYGERKEIGLVDPEAELQRIKELIAEQSLPEGENGTKE